MLHPPVDKFDALDFFLSCPCGFFEGCTRLAKEGDALADFVELALAEDPVDPREGDLERQGHVVGEYEGCVADYLESLERLRVVGFKTLYSGHGPAIEDPGATLDAFEAHRRGRIRQVADILTAKPGASAEELLTEVYGSTIPVGLEGAALQSLQAIREFLS